MSTKNYGNLQSFTRLKCLIYSEGLYKIPRSVVPRPLHHPQSTTIASQIQVRLPDPFPDPHYRLRKTVWLWKTGVRQMWCYRNSVWHNKAKNLPIRNVQFCDITLTMVVLHTYYSSQKRKQKIASTTRTLRAMYAVVLTRTGKIWVRIRLKFPRLHIFVDLINVFRSSSSSVLLFDVLNVFVHPFAT